MARLIVIVAGETSGDNLGAALIERLRALSPDLEFEGIAGPAMIAAGCRPWAGSEALAVMGLFEVVRHLPRLLRLRTRITRRILARAPAAFIGVDAPEFNLGLAARLHRAGIRTVQYVSPQVWAWRQGRVRRMADTLDLVLCLLPFEPAFYARAGLKAEFVGHPLADRLPLEPDRAAARRALGLADADRVIALLPGSRRQEVARLAPDFLAAAAWLKQRRPGLRFIAPLANAEVRPGFERALAEFPGLALAVTDGGAARALSACDVALVASGTATLEALLCKRPMVVAYRLGSPTAAVLRALGVMKAPYFAQPNLLAGEAVVPELFQEAATPARLGAALEAWLDDPARVRRLEARFLGIHRELRQDASARAARAVLALLDPGRAPA